MRGKEALDLIDAFASGHNGSLATMHASSIDNALRRLSLLVSRHEQAPRFIEESIAMALDLVIVVSNDKYRHVSQIAKIEDFKEQNFTYTLMGA